MKTYNFINILDIDIHLSLEVTSLKSESKEISSGKELAVEIKFFTK